MRFLAVTLLLSLCLAGIALPATADDSCPHGGSCEVIECVGAGRGGNSAEVCVRDGRVSHEVCVTGYCTR